MADEGAQAAIRRVLSEYGLSSLGDWAWGQFLTGSPIEQIMLDMRNTTEYKTRFPAMSTLSGRGRSMTEAEYIAYERQATGMFRAAGMPPGFYDSPEDFANLIGNEVSVNELQQRVSNAYTQLAFAPTVVKDAFASFYGPGSDGALAAYILDPGKAMPAIERQVAAAKFAGTGMGFGFEVNRGFSEDMATYGLADPTAGFARAAQTRALEIETIGETAVGSNITQEDYLAGSFGVKSDEPTRRRLEERVSAFSGSGGTAVTSTGAVGLGGSQK